MAEPKKHEEPKEPKKPDAPKAAAGVQIPPYDTDPHWGFLRKEWKQRAHDGNCKLCKVCEHGMALTDAKCPYDPTHSQA